MSAGLVVMMLLMFATVFQLATGSLATQRGIAENDQRTRMLTTVMRRDVASRTFRTVIPWTPADDVPEQEDTNRRGYLYISENDPESDTDDVLQFTALITAARINLPAQDPTDLGQVVPSQMLTGPRQTPFFGRAARTFWDDRDGDGQGPPTDNNEPVYGNQPEFDGDGQALNGSATSFAAEVTYFLRPGGNLYRRVMLIRQRTGTERDPRANSVVQSPSGGGQPFVTSFEIFDFHNDGQAPRPPRWDDRRFDPTGNGIEGRFYRDFDYSVYALDERDNQNNFQNLLLKFHGLDSLDNHGGSTALPLAKPFYRFGHSHRTGQPREYIGAGGQPTGYMGRFTHEETSDRAFVYPFIENGGNPNPYSRTLTDMNPADSVIDQYAGGARRSEDLLLSHVHGFDVKVWDDRAGDWKDIGWRDNPPGVIGDYGQSQNGHRSMTQGVASIIYGPWPSQPQNRVFDTWHPDLHFDRMSGRLLLAPDPSNPDHLPAPPPYRAVRPGRDGMPGTLDDEAIPLRAIQVTVRFYDVGSDQMRQLTLEFSLLD